MASPATTKTEYRSMRAAIGDDAGCDPDISVLDYLSLRNDAKCHCMALPSFPETFESKKLRLYLLKGGIHLPTEVYLVVFCWKFYLRLPRHII